jgi:hypothetical protein
MCFKEMIKNAGYFPLREKSSRNEYVRVDQDP